MATILIVVDDAPAREQLALLLGRGQHAVMAAATGAHALELASAQPPELILADFLLPGQTALELILRLWANPAFREIRLIFLTDPEMIRAVEPIARAFGVRHILPLPADHRAVLSAVTASLQAPARTAPPPLVAAAQNGHWPQFDNASDAQVARLQAELAERRQTDAMFRLQSAALNAAANAVMITDQSGAIVWVNPAFARLTGYTLAEVQGRNARLLKSGRQDAAYYRRMWTTILGGGGWQGEVTNRRKDGTLYVQDQTITPLLDERGQVTHFIAIQQDVTERKRTEAALRASQEEVSLLARFPSENPDPVLRLAADGAVLFANAGSQPVLDQWRIQLGERVPPEVQARITGALTSGEQAAFDISTEQGVYSLFIAPVAEMGYVNLYGRDITQRRQRERELEAVGQVSAALRSAASRADMLPVIVDQLMGMFEATGAAIVLQDPVSGELVVAETRGVWAVRSGERIAPGQGVSGAIIATDQPYVSADARADPNFLRPDLLVKGSAVAGVPLRARQDTIGTLWAIRERTFAPSDVRVLTAIADIVGSAIQRATLFEATEEGLRRLTALRTIDQAITGSLDLHLILNIVLDQATHLLGAAAAAVLLLEPNSQTLAYAVGLGFHGVRLSGLRRRLGEGLAGRAALDRCTLSVYDLASSPGALSDQHSLGLAGYQSCHAAPLIAKGMVVGVMELWHRDAHRRDAGWLEFLEALAGQAAIAVDGARLFDDLQQSNAHLLVAYDATIEGWSRALDLRDHETEGHTMRVTETTLSLARVVGLPETELIHIRRGALLHDIGKMGVPDSILRKPGPLTDDEWAIMRRHPTLAYEMLLPIAYLRPALDIPYCHHEKWDGTGYPRGLKGPQIPLAARVFAVVDVWDALRTDRPYRTAWAETDVIAYIQAHTGSHFDPMVAQAFLKFLAVQ